MESSFSHFELHPGYEEYIDFQNGALALISHQNIQDQLPDGFILDSFVENSNTHGVINNIFILNTNKGKLLMRVHNTHKFWRGFARVNHVICHKLAQNIGVPVSQIIKHGQISDKGFTLEYILFEYMEDNLNLKEFMDAIPNQIRETKAKNIGIQLLDIVKKLQSIEVEQTLGAFGENGRIHFINDGPKVGPCQSLKQILLQIINWSKQQLLYLQADKEVDFDLYGMIDTVIRKLPDFDLRDEVMVFSHNDLNPSNILVNQEGEITAILDWDSANVYYPYSDVDYVKGFVGDYVEKNQDFIQWFSSEIQKRNIKELKQSNQRIKEWIYVVDCLKWSCFWVNNWYRGQQLIQDGIKQSRLNELNNFKISFESLFDI